MTLVQDYQKIKDRLIAIPRELGMPQYRTLVIRKKSHLNEQRLYDHIIDPTPKVVNVNERQISEIASRDTVQISVEDYFVKHLSRVNYTPQFLLTDVEFYILDYSNNDCEISGIRCKPIFLDESKTTSYEMILKRVSDHETLEVV
jgi:hypothetical protein